MPGAMQWSDTPDQEEPEPIVHKNLVRYYVPILTLRKARSKNVSVSTVNWQ